MDYTPNYDHCGYLKPVLETKNLRTNVLKAIEVIQTANIQFDAIAFRGMSGALAAPVLAVNLDKTMILVRKPGDTETNGKSHSNHKTEGDKAARTYIIVDDFFSTGRTAEAIQRAVKEFAPQAVCIGGLSLRDVGFYAESYLEKVKDNDQENAEFYLNTIFHKEIISEVA